MSNPDSRVSPSPASSGPRPSSSTTGADIPSATPISTSASSSPSEGSGSGTAATTTSSFVASSSPPPETTGPASSTPTGSSAAMSAAPCGDPSIITGNDNFVAQCSVVYAGNVLDTGNFTLLQNAVTSCVNNKQCQAVHCYNSHCFLMNKVNGYYPGQTNAQAAYNKQKLGAGPAAITTGTPAASLVTPSATLSSSATQGTEASSTSSNGKQQSKGLSGGEVAGAVVGAAVGAALIAFLLTLLLCRRKRRPYRPGSESSAEKSGFAHSWEAFMPQSADDQKIIGAIQSLYSQIDLHVENYYQPKVNPQENDSQHSLMGHLSGVDSAKLPGSLETLMSETERPLPIIKHCFAWVILNKLSPSTGSENTLLPPEFGRMPSQMTNSKARTGEERAASEAYNYWRVLTAYLMHPSRSNSSHGNRSAILSTAAHLSSAFEPWSKNDKSAQEHLESVLKSASETGLLIISQPSRFAFQWDVLRPSQHKSVAVFPAFEKTCDEEGRTLSQIHVLVRPTVDEI